MYVESCMILVVVNRLSSPVVVLDRLPGLCELKYDSATACGPPLYLCSYKLVGSTTASPNESAPKQDKNEQPDKMREHPFGRASPPALEAV